MSQANPLRLLNAAGQSVWYDNIQRSMLTSGMLARLIAEDDLRGITSNPTIFEKAIAGSSDYDEALCRELQRNTQQSSRDLFFTLAIEDIRAAADIVRGKAVAPGVRAMVVPGSGLVKQAAEAEGLDAVFKAAGFEWREAGCSMCLGMNPDKLTPGQRCASTSNRNFEGRQGPGGRTHLLSPAMAAAAAITGRLTGVREMA